MPLSLPLLNRIFGRVSLSVQNPKQNVLHYLRRKFPRRESDDADASRNIGNTQSVNPGAQENENPKSRHAVKQPGRHGLIEEHDVHVGRVALIGP
jgi:hypothetical protein